MMFLFFHTLSWLVNVRKLSTKELILLNCGVGEGFWKSLGLQRDGISQSWRKSALKWKDWFWSWSSNTLVTWCEELTHWKRLWYWERLKAGGEGEDRGWDDQMASWFNGHEFEQALGVGDGQGSLACCSPWVAKSWTWLSDGTELNWACSHTYASELYVWSFKNYIFDSLSLRAIFYICKPL